jgi:hypothetical protein
MIFVGSTDTHTSENRVVTDKRGSFPVKATQVVCAFLVWSGLEKKTLASHEKQVCEVFFNHASKL